MKKHGPNERTDKNSRKRTKQNGDLSLAELKTVVIGMLKELIGYFNSIKKTQIEMKFTLSEIKKNLQGINRGRDEAESQIRDLEDKEAKNNQSEQ